jgi:hypothetical protein
VQPDGQPIPIPEFPSGLGWINTPFVRLGTLLGQNCVLVWFWDYTSLNSLRSLPYLREWQRRYADKGLTIVGVHSPQFDFGKRIENVAEAVGRLEIEFPVACDSDYEVWRLYGTEVWPSTYLWDRSGVLKYVHFAEGDYEQTERVIGELLREIDDELELPAPMAPLRATDAPGAEVLPPTNHIYLNETRMPKAVEAGDELVVEYLGAAATAVLDGRGRADVLLDGEPLKTMQLDGPRLYELVESPGHEQHELMLRFRNEAHAYAFSFAPGTA